MILTGPEILKRIDAGDIRITPFDQAAVNPASIDLHLGPNVVTYEAQNGGELNPFGDNETHSTVIGTLGTEFKIFPGKLYLMHTLEQVYARDLVPVLDGKSTLGRYGLSVHQTAGYGDPGFDGQYTLEVTTVYPIRLRVGMRIAQIRFHETEGEIVSYQKAGHYTGGRSFGAVPGRKLT